MKLFLSILPILASSLVSTRAYGTEGSPGENPSFRPLSRRTRSSTTTSPSPRHSSSAAPAVYTNICGPPVSQKKKPPLPFFSSFLSEVCCIVPNSKCCQCDDLCTCDSHGHMNCHSNPWFCYDTCCKKE
ncbi:hypothetical protein F5X96DRAFT_456794 [Biscogniauxia mediterranea]|nr:hypothetical protein F5X96DRAFT_456794 [Biscogniauxia mediterranea]